jgi:predicted anti-sigma-YlaC factor YlaD
VRPLHGHCERARQWASADVDGELSTFERALLADHLDRCPSCAAFSSDLRGLTIALRAAPSERFEGIVIGRIRRQVRLRLAPAAAAMAIAAVGLGSLLASSQLNRAPGLQPTEAVAGVGVDFALNGGRSEKLKQRQLARLISLTRGPGPVLP